MSGKCLLDTNVAIRVLNQELDLRTHQGQGLQTLLCLTVVGELYFGAAKSRRPDNNRSKIQRLLQVCPVVPLDLQTAERYGALKVELRRKGRPIPENDLWIAACALRHGLTLVTRDRHFDEVGGLTTQAW